MTKIALALRRKEVIVAWAFQQRAPTSGAPTTRHILAKTKESYYDR